VVAPAPRTTRSKGVRAVCEGQGRAAGARRGSGPGRGRVGNALPKSAAELDSEIDAFMAVDSASGTPAVKSAENVDVERPSIELNILSSGAKTVNA
jgi:hypothetical protein